MKGLEEIKPRGEEGQTELDFSMTAEEKQAFATRIRRKRLASEKLTPEEAAYADRDDDIFGKDNDPRHPEV